MTVTVISVHNFKLTLAKFAQTLTMSFLGLFNHKRLKVKQRKITSKTNIDKYIEI